MRNKVNYLLGITITGFGDGIQQIALMWYIFHLTGEAASIGLMIAIYYLPSMLLTPFLSVYVDHRDSKNIVVATDLLRFLLVFIMAGLIVFKVESAALFYILQFALAICYTIYKPASQSFVKEAFLDKDIPFVISKASSFSEAATLVGMGASGVFLVQLSLATSFFINSATFLAAAILYFLIKRVRPKITKEGKIKYFSEIVEGWNFIDRQAGMKFLLFLSILNSISIQMTTTLMLPLAKQFHGASGLYSSFEMAFSIGGIVAGLIVTYFLRKLKQRVILITMAGMMVSALLLYWNDFKIAAVICIFILGLFTMSHLIIVQTLIQLNTTKEYIGRVIGLRTILASFVKISSALLTGTLISQIGINNILLAFAVLILLSFFTLGNLKKVSVPI
ncbi:MFS transporter [Bacillus sp. FJAT-49736]|uniref:MFS transporter n=1 Tax=Bacillus sp. FJAT-49736 TaxID=2833582 RepID=UPI001BC9FD5B|nr:MFS transporter [Bacillus sp. FJAT-49736]MBS4174383.1 MFS transporter [Bacillus sp. FJAT-49736]